MEIVRTILTILYFIVGLSVVILALVQTKEDDGLSSTITGSSSGNFYEKNKGKTREGKLKSRTIALAITFAVLTIILGILYVA